MKTSPASWRSGVPALNFRPPPSDASAASLRSALVLVSLLVVVVPAVALTTGLSLLVLVPLAGVAYLAYLLRTDQLVVGFGSAFFVLLTFNANVPLVFAPGTEHADVYMFDVLLVPVAAFGLYWHWQSSKRLPALGRLAIAALGLFACWSALAALVGNGPSRLAALIFSLEQVKFTAVFLVAALYVLHTDFRCAVYPLLVAVAGHTLFAFAQGANGMIFGLSYLGETSTTVIGQTTIGPFVYQAGQYTGGFAGTSRVLTGLVLLCLPSFVVESVDTGRKTLFALLGTSLAGVFILMSETDAGWGAFMLLMVVAALVLGARYAWRSNVSFGRASFVTAASAGIITILREWDRIAASIGRVVTAVVSVLPLSESGSSTSSSGASGGASTTSATPAGGSSSAGSGTSSGTSPSVSGGGVIDTSTLGIRLKQYESALDIARHHPWFGIGGSNFNIIAPTYGIPAEMSIHNIFLAYLAATGIPGLLLFLIAIGAVSVLLLRGSVRLEGQRQLMSIALLAGIASYLAFTSWDTLHNSTPAMATFWAVCGIGLGMDT